MTTWMILQKCKYLIEEHYIAFTKKGKIRPINLISLPIMPKILPCFGVTYQTNQFIWVNWLFCALLGTVICFLGLTIFWLCHDFEGPTGSPCDEGEGGQKSAKIGKNRQKSAKIGKNRQESVGSVYSVESVDSVSLRYRFGKFFSLSIGIGSVR